MSMPLSSSTRRARDKPSQLVSVKHFALREQCGLIASRVMGDVLEIASAILSQSQRRVEIAAQNVANITTPGYKARAYAPGAVGFDTLLGTPDSGAVTVDFSKGKPVETGNAFDLAIAGDGFFVVRSGDKLLYTRHGQFQRDSEGRLATSDGLVVQQAGGGDVALKGGTFKVAPDGLITENGAPVGRLAVVDFPDRAALHPNAAGGFEAPDGLASPVEALVRQGALEASNVSTGDEMVRMMEALRRAETGQRLVTTYDDLMGRAISTFGQG